MVRRLYLTVLSLFCVLFAASALANSNIDAVIEKVRSPSYDCPSQSLLPELEQTLTLESLTPQQRFALTVAKGQFLICRGKYEEAEKMLLKAIMQSNIDESSYAFASAIYQIGFTYDARENPARCKYYQQAQDLSSPERHSDIFTSSSLGLINYCSESSSPEIKLGKMFGVLKRYSDNGSPGELAHIHNAIGLLYGNLEQHALAAEQYLKAHKMGLLVYKGSNKVSIIISAIVSLLSSGQIDKAYQSILELGALNSEINTPLSNFLYQYALSIYHRKTRDYNNLAYTLPDLEEATANISSSLGHKLVAWHKAELCLHNKELTCVKQYLADIGALDKIVIPKVFETNLDYLSFNVSMYLALKDIALTKEAHNIYSKEVTKRREVAQDTALIVGAANLYTRIYDLESAIEKAEEQRRNTLYTAILVFLLFVIITGYVLRKKHVARKAIDPVTLLLNADSAIARINKLDAPKKGRAIAIAIFDISNLREITRKMGSTKGDFVLRQIAQTFQNVIRGNDILGRFGTDQFILCLHNIEERSARQFFDRVQSALESTFESDTNDDYLVVESQMSVFIATEKITGLNDILDDIAVSIDMGNRSGSN
ncbi:diguanylate cyclase [Alteromonas portus]|uniref:Diguanylate cyclase n=1 Tax=Alteromonas portus TaxID=2565549 RepID=A0A4U0ZIM0_9ALTE|nr:diguanylate cyclase [Alteromonas portus]TKB01912.1 diguanylate cyclase [Alteromonas portus]